MERRSDVGQGAFFVLGSDDRRMVVLGSADSVAASGIANDQFGMELLGDRGPIAIFVAGFDGVHDDADGGAAHGFEWLTHGGQRRSGKRGNGNVVKSSHGTLLGNADPRLGQGAHGPERGEIVEGKNGGEFFLLLQQFLGEAVAVFEAGVGVEDVGNLEDQAGVEFELYGLSEFLDAAPAGRAVDQPLRPANDSDAAVPALVEMLEGEAASGFIVHHDGTDAIAGNFPANGGGGNLLLVEIREHMNVHEEPVGDDDQTVDVTFEKHFQITLETISLVVGVGKDREDSREDKERFQCREEWECRRDR